MCQFLSVTGAVKGIENPDLLRSGGAVRGCARNASSLTVSHPCFARSNRAQMSLAGLLASGRVCKLSCPECVPSRRCLSFWPVDSYALIPVTVALPQRIHTAFPFHPTQTPVSGTFRRTPGTFYLIALKAMLSNQFSQMGGWGAVRSSFPARSVAE